ncbi:MAG: hypothetical protein VW455_10105 [Nitrospinota bacterium]
MKKAIAILGAVSEEIAGIKKSMNIADRIRLGKSEAWPGKWLEKEIVLVRTGVGKQRAADATRKVIEKFHPQKIISLGYAGALINELKVGDLFVAKTILSSESDETTFEMDDPEEMKWLEKANQIPLPKNFKLRVGKLITVDKVIHTPEGKRELGNRFGAEAVEMETLKIALLSRENNIPFISVRGISDEVGHELIDSSSFLGSDGEISKLKAGWYVLTHPGSLKNALSLRSHTLVATQNLTDFIAKLLTN